MCYTAGVPDFLHGPAGGDSPPLVSGPRRTPPWPAPGASLASLHASCQTPRHSRHTPLHSKTHKNEMSLMNLQSSLTHMQTSLINLQESLVYLQICQSNLQKSPIHPQKSVSYVQKSHKQLLKCRMHSFRTLRLACTYYTLTQLI